MPSQVHKKVRYSLLRWGRVPPLPPPLFFGQGGEGGGSLISRGGVPPVRQLQKPMTLCGGPTWGSCRWQEKGHTGNPLNVMGGGGYPPPQCFSKRAPITIPRVPGPIRLPIPQALAGKRKIVRHNLKTEKMPPLLMRNHSNRPGTKKRIKNQIPGIT